MVLNIEPGCPGLYIFYTDGLRYGNYPLSCPKLNNL
jgi:hypothetical protein